MSTKITAQEIERVVAAYQGGEELREGSVPIGAKLVPEELDDELVEHFAKKGFAMRIEAHPDEEALVMLELTKRSS